VINDRKVTVVVPAYNVATHVRGVAAAIPEFVDRILVIDDASTDETSEVARSVDDARVQVIRHEQNRGVGGAMATGFRHALEEGSDIVVKCDGDGQMDPALIARLIEPLLAGRADYAKGCRFHHIRELRAMPRVRLFGNVALTFLTKLASGYWHVLDPQNGFVAIRGDVLGRMPLDRIAQGYFFENDMLIRLNGVAARVADVALPARYGDEPSFLRPGRILLGFPPRLLAGMVRRIFWRYVFYDVSPVAVFLAVGSLLFLLGSGFGGYHWITNARAGRPTPIGTVFLAALPVVLGFQLLLQALVLDIQNSPRPSGDSDPNQRR
jgi:glycosyltransferase involved in cell wall biosynthesis